MGTDATRPTLVELLAAWNGPENAAVRAAVRPPRGPAGPFPVIAAEPGTTATPQGPYEVHVGIGLRRTSVGGASPARPCLVWFWYPAGYEGEPATVVLHARPGLQGFDLAGAHMHVGASTDVSSAPGAIHHIDGTLSLVPHEPEGS